MIDAGKALQELQDGNARFVAGISGDSTPHITSIPKTKDGQTPFAIILGCSDSRVPAEIIFDQGMGDLFVIRVAGNIVAPSQLGSIEFAVEQFGTALVVVLGHSSCGAVTATLADIQNPQTGKKSHVFSIVDRIRPTVEPLLGDNFSLENEDLLDAAIKANIRSSTHQLRTESALLASYMEQGKLMIVGAEYSLTTGKVEFFDMPDSSANH